MILIISKSEGLANTAREIFFGMGYVSDVASPEEAVLTLTDKHRAVLALGREGGCPWERTVGALRLLAGDIPLVAVREDVTDASFGLFDRVYPNSVYSSAVLSDILSLSRERERQPIGEYRLGELDASVRSGAPALGGVRLGLTRTETMILRSIICRTPEAVPTAYILAHAFRTGRSPTEAGVRTHLSAINRKLRAVSDGSCIVSCEEGYRLSRAAEPLTV